MRTLILLLLFISFEVVADWKPPASPDPEVILTEARADAHAGAYEEALAKHVWFHHNALKYDESLYGVRLSFAIRDWLQLGIKYPPAMKKLKSVRDDACLKVKSDENPFDYFHDCSSLSRNLLDYTPVVENFLWIEKNRPELAKTVYGLAEDALIDAKKYTICGKYLTPRATYDNLVKNFNENMEMYKTDMFKDIDKETIKILKDQTHISFLNDAAKLIALLVKNNRKDEAVVYYREALLESERPDSEAILRNALIGEFPVVSR